MKNISKSVILIALIAFSCSSKKTTLEKEEATSIVTSNVTSDCPEDGICTTQIFRNRSLLIKTDEFGSTYYNMSDNNQTSVILYQYKRNVKEGLQDGNYTEEIVFEINNSDTAIALSDFELQKTKMLFSRLCFCRGQTGYYKVTAGNLKLNQIKNELKFDLDFKITQVPQIINAIHTSVKEKSPFLN